MKYESGICYSDEERKARADEDFERKKRCLARSWWHKRERPTVLYVSGRAKGYRTWGECFAYHYGETLEDYRERLIEEGAK